MERNEMRQKFESLGLRYSDINSQNIGDLKQLLGVEFEKHNIDLAPNFIKIKKSRKKDFDFTENGTISYCAIRLNGSWFDDREAITFNRDGFIGFAGWADNKNIQPILKAFDKWLETLTVLT